MRGHIFDILDPPPPFGQTGQTWIFGQPPKTTWNFEEPLLPTDLQIRNFYEYFPKIHHETNRTFFEITQHFFDFMKNNW